MNFFVFRNSTVEPFFSDSSVTFSGYGEITAIPESADGFIWFYLLPVKADLDTLSAETDGYVKNLELVLNHVPVSKPFLIFTLAPLHVNIIETGNFSLWMSVHKYNESVIRFSEERKNVKVLDLQSFISRFPSELLIDWKYYYVSQMVLNPKLAGAFGVWFNQLLNTFEMKRKKCLVLDLDNTLWGGVLGEDGINGIKIGGDYPGNAYLDFQRSILELYKAGVMLAICSKNNESDVIEAWEKNPNILIRREHLAGSRINWDNKAQNIKELAGQLNIGLDSMVFLDDSPSERELVKQLLPDVETPEFPAKPYFLTSFIKEISEKHFRMYQLTKEDRAKTRQYQENTAREEFQKGFSDFSEYLTSLDIKIKVLPPTDVIIPRLAQLTQKTNQFNLTTRRYTEADIYAFLAKSYLIRSISVSDRFGESGITGLIIISLDKEQKTADIDTLLMSCRVLGKGIEEAFILHILQMLIDQGIKRVNGHYRKTSKNEQVSQFFDRVGFTVKEDKAGTDDIKDYCIDLKENSMKVKPFYTIINE